MDFEGGLTIAKRLHPIHALESKYGGAGESRTPDTWFRKPKLYPSELQPRAMIVLQNAGRPFDPPAGFVDRAGSCWMRAGNSCGVFWSDWSAEDGWEVFAAAHSR